MSYLHNGNRNNMSNKVDLLWTGGWDSTFRLLQILFVEKKAVKTHYIIRPQECTGKEIDTIHNIRRKISRSYPEQRKLILPITFMSIDEIKSNNLITEEYKKVRKTRKLNKQYEILARYCNQIGVNNMELSVLSSETFEHVNTDSIIFQYFELPLLGLTKQKMYEIARENGWMDLMKMTWFCRRPKKGRPCGFCGPCTDAVIAGMGWRLPLSSRFIAYIQLPFRKWWRNNYQKQSGGIYSHIKYFLKEKV